MIELKSTQANITLKSPTVVGASVDLSNYYTKAQVDALIPDVSGFITEIPAEYVTESELASKGYLTEHQSLEEYAKKSEIPTVPTKVSAFHNDAGYLTEHQSLADYSTTTQVQNMIDTAIAGITDGEAVSY